MIRAIALDRHASAVLQAWVPPPPDYDRHTDHPEIFCHAFLTSPPVDPRAQKTYAWSRPRTIAVAPPGFPASSFPELSRMQHDILTELGKSLVQGSLTDASLLARTSEQSLVQILPDANVIKIGGQSFIDRGRAAVFPLIDEIIANLHIHKMIIGTGAGTRARHAYSVGIDLGMPTGVLSVLGTFVSMQNARMLHYLLARHGIPFIEPVQFPQLPLYLEERGAVIFFGMPPYTFWQKNPDVGRIPPHRTDTGCYLVSEVFGAKSMIYIKDEKGLYTADPKKDRNAKFIPKITLEELRAMDLQDVVVERAVLDIMKNAESRRSIQIINGLIPGNLTRALNGEEVGTIIYQD